MVSILVGASLFWVFAVTCFFIGDLIKWFRSKKMSYVGAPLGVYGNNGTTATTMSTNSTGTKTTFSGKVYMKEGAVVENMDVGEGLRLISFFLQSRYPEVFEEYNAIKKIKES